MNPMPRLQDAEVKYFESRGEEAAPSLLEEAPAAEPMGGGQDAADDAGSGTAGTLPETKPEKGNREGRFVPLQALQEERAEKKQLREELRQFREWQAQLTQRLQQMPVAQQGNPMPDPQTRPLDYISHVLGSVQHSTAELQQWRQQQELTSRQQAAEQQALDWAEERGRDFSTAQPDYPDAYRYAEEARDRELKTLGYGPTQRAAIMRMNRLEVIHNAAQQGLNPAEMIWEYARARGFAPKTNRGNPIPQDGQAKIAAGLQTGGGKLNRGGETGEGEVSAKDLAGISDPEEFERAWKRVFGRQR